MIEIRRILCPVDFSDFSRRALDHAFAVARWYEATVTVLHVASPAPVAAYGLRPVVFDPVVLSSADRDRLLAETEAFVEAEKAPGVPIEVAVREGPAAAEVLDQAGSMAADLIVIGTHGRSGFERLLLGSVTERVLRKAPCPVLTVPKRLPDPAPAGPVLYKRILCPVDFSDSSTHALKYAMSMAEEADGQLTALHVIAHEFENSIEIEAIAAESGISIDDFLKKREEARRRRLQEALAGADEFCTVDPVLAQGKPWREILRIAAERGTDLIVIGVQGRGATDLLVFGSTTQHVVREAVCPVLTIRRG